MILQKLIAIGGIALILGIMWLMSEDKKRFPFRIVFWGLGLQLILAGFILHVPVVTDLFKWFSDQISFFLSFSLKGGLSVFGNILDSSHYATFGFQLALIVMTTIVFFSAFVSMLYHFGVIQKIVYGVAWVMQKTLRTSGIESLSAASNIFLGQTEAPLLVRHYLHGASRSEINSIMVGGFATIAGGVMAAFIQMGISPAALITASLISAPGGLMLSKIVIPPTTDTKSLSEIKNTKIVQADNFLEAITIGAGDGMKLAINVIAMLVAFVSLIALLDACFNQIDLWLTAVGFEHFPDSINQLFGYIFQPFAFLVGIPSEEAVAFGSLVGTKIGINEFIAYTELSEMVKNGTLSPRTIQLATFALCGFANFSSIAIQIGGLGALVPEKRALLAQLGFKAMIIGAMVNLLTCIIASLFI